ncbi:MFS transporter [Belnapia rosea]|uniref:Predicted arabinose efflux permease, MFS family n=1 Tax=Belnapia rosea TaxID=938405 RepID=A0A1G6U3X4_9PROT|nr:MFS transporter [Belnapia rosea]SDD35255.1 Predicted arabinose efflux permease, MFS family [Belnapia rosea]
MPQKGGLAVPILALALGHVLSNAVRTLPALAADRMQASLGLSPEGLAAVTGTFSLAFALALVPVGVGLDRLGARRTALILLAVAGLGAVLAALAPGAWTMLLAQAVLGAGCAGMLMAPMTYAARAVPPSRFGLWSGIILTFGNTGMLLSGSPLAWLVDWQGWRAGYWAMAGFALLALLAVALVVRQPPPARRDRTSLWQDAREVLAIAASPALRPLMVFGAASFATIIGLRGLWGGPWLMEAKGLTRIEAGHILTACALAMTLAPVFCGWVERRLGRPTLMLAGSHLAVAGLILALLAGRGLPPGWDAAIFVLIGLLVSVQPVAFGQARAAVPPERAGRALSALNIAFFAGAAALQPISGLAASRGGVGAALASLAVALIASGTGFLLLRRRA